MRKTIVSPCSTAANVSPRKFVIDQVKPNAKAILQVTQWVAFLLLLVLFAQPAIAQLPTGTFLGVVKDGSGATVADAKVTAVHTDTGQARMISTGEDGAYRLSALPVGHYSIRVERDGFKTRTLTGLVLDVSQEQVVNIALEVGTSSIKVEVSADAQLVNTTSSSVGGLVNEARMADLPLNGRNYIDLTLLQAGVSQDKNINSVAGNGGTWYSSNGAPPRSNYYLLDGAPLVNLLGTTSASIAGTTLGVDGIKEYRVMTNAFGAQYGMTMGSQVEIVSKGGSNEFHGDVFEYLRNDVLDARNFFDKTPAYPGKRLPPYKRNNFGGALGGPIKKDKTFFYGVYEGLRENLGTTNVDNVIPAADKVVTNNPAIGGGTVAPVVQPLLALFPNPNLPNNQFTFPFIQITNVNFGQMRIDHSISVNDMLFVRYTIDDADQLRPRTFPLFHETWDSRDQFLTLSESHIFTPAVGSTFRLSFSRTNYQTTTFTDPSLTGPNFSFMPGEPVGILNIGGVTSYGPDVTNPSYKKQNIYTLSDDVFHSHGRHAMTYGVLVNHIEDGSDDHFQFKGSLSFPNLATFLLAKPSIISVATPGANMNRDYRYNTFGMYFQDDWRLSPRVMLNLGTRYEFATQPTEINGRQAALINPLTDVSTTPGPVIKSPSRTNVSPRVGLAWDVLGNGKLAVRAGAGLYYDIGGIGSTFLFGALSTPPISNTDLIPNPGSFTIPLTLPAGAAGKTIRGPLYDLHQPHLFQYNVTVERELPFGTVLSLGYVGTRGIDLYQSEEGNPIAPAAFVNGYPTWIPGSLRRNPAIGSYQAIAARAESWYNALQANFTKRLKRGLEFQSSFTWSKSLDDIQSQIGSDGTYPGSVVGTYAENPRLFDYGPSMFDLKYNWRTNALYHLPDAPWHGFAAGALRGWWVGNIISVQSGFPFTPVLASNRSLSGVFGGSTGLDRPNLSASFNAGSVITGSPSQWFNPAMFALQPVGTLGNAGRDILHGPGLFDWDFSMAKNTNLPWLGDRTSLQFRAEFFNLLNHANFSLPGNTVFAGTPTDPGVPLPTAGVITSTATTSRQIQLVLKLLF